MFTAWGGATREKTSYAVRTCSPPMCAERFRAPHYTVWRGEQHVKAQKKCASLTANELCGAYMLSLPLMCAERIRDLLCLLALRAGG